MLQIAGALNCLNVKGFDDKLIKKLLSRQSYPYAKEYSFPKPLIFDSTKIPFERKTIINKSKISDFRKDYKAIEKLILKNFDNSCNPKIIEIIEKKNKAYITVSRDNGCDYYLIIINKDNTIEIDLISSFIT